MATEQEPDQVVVGDGEDAGGLLDGMRGMGVGTQDPNIVGEVGPTDIPPGPEDADAPGPLGGDADPTDLGPSA